MFDKLSEKITGSLQKLTGRGARLNEAAIKEALKEVRLALLEADVNFRVVKGFLERVSERIMVMDHITTITPGQHVIKMVYEELTALMGTAHQGLDFKGPPPHVLMLVGLQGSGKTTTAAKLALYLKKLGRNAYLVPADVARPAAVHQLTVLAEEAGVPVYAPKEGETPLAIVGAALTEAARLNRDTVLVDTAGRLTVDVPLMEELSEIKRRARPREILLVADAMTGQEAVTIARDFNDRLGVTGVILTKMEGDARAGAAMSMRAAVGKPLKFIGTGERLDAIEPFHPDRTASLILGMGDVLTLMEKTREVLDQEEAQAYLAKFNKGNFTLGDLRDQFRRLSKMGSFESLLSMIPGIGKLKRFHGSKPDTQQMNMVVAIIDSMTPEERVNPDILDASRRRRIARGSGTSVADVNSLIRTFSDMRRMLQQVSRQNFRPEVLRKFFS
ncbi:MAG: signal recognition particle protein [Deltaproteobacteria bacterium]|nr:signal recognition particle protein [Deltaproteobacteria bacterium]